MGTYRPRLPQLTSPQRTDEPSESDLVVPELEQRVAEVREVREDRSVDLRVRALVGVPQQPQHAPPKDLGEEQRIIRLFLDANMKNANMMAIFKVRYVNMSRTYCRVKPMTTMYTNKSVSVGTPIKLR